MSSLVAASTHSLSAPSHPSRGTRSTNRTRNARLEIAVLVLIALLLALGAWITHGDPHPTVSSARVRVERGQTLWALAAEHPITGLTTEQTARFIAQLNRYSDDRVAAGTILSVPVQPNSNEGLALAMR